MLQRVVGIGANGEDDDGRRIVAFREVCEESQQGLAFVTPVGADPFLCLVDGDADARGPFALVPDDAPRHRRLDKLGQQRPQLRGPLLRCRAQVGARTRRKDTGESVDEAVFAGQRRALGTNHGQGEIELRVVAPEPGQETQRAGTTTLPAPEVR